MPLFRNSKKDKDKEIQQSSLPPTRSNSSKSINSHNSVTTSTSPSSPNLNSNSNSNLPQTKKLKSFFKSSNSNVNTNGNTITNDHASPSIQLSNDLGEKLSIKNHHDVHTLKNNRLRKRVSTILEDDLPSNKRGNNSDEFDSSEEDDEDDDEYDDDDDDDDTDGNTSYDTDDSEDFEIEEEEHSHKIQLRSKSSTQHNLTSQLVSIMGYCGLNSSTSTTTPDNQSLHQLANEELKRTFSLIDDNCKILRLSPTIKRNDPQLTVSVIGDQQLILINTLKSKLNNLLNLKNDLNKQYQSINGSKTLYDRYGVVKEVIGRGSYGLIKVIDPNASDIDLNKKNSNLFSSGNVLYAVKELQKRSNDVSNDNDINTPNVFNGKEKESREKFIERVISEFIISSTLNNKHIVKSIDFMVTLPPLKNSNSSFNSNYISSNNLNEENLKINQVMQCTSGGDLFNYIKNLIQNKLDLSIDEIDCFIKQISKGLWYMHKHGVAHCDLKLENVLINYDFNQQNNHNGDRTKINLKISDFGKSNVFKTKWDNHEQFLPYSNGPIGSEPYISPEEFVEPIYNFPNILPNYKQGFSLIKKDCWALGIIILVLFNLRKNFFANLKMSEGKDNELEQEMIVKFEKQKQLQKNETDNNLTSDIFNLYNSSYIWQSTDIKQHLLASNNSTNNKEKKYKDKFFTEYTKNRMIANYDEITKEWTILKAGHFKPIETLFVGLNKSSTNSEEFWELCELRKYFIYKLLDLNPESRLNTDDLIKGDWIKAIDNCC